MKIFLIILFLTIVYSSDPTLAEHSLQVYGNASLGYYYVKIFVGHPPQEQTVIIDTGSGQLALPCNKCKKCSKNHINPPFDMSKSKTAQYITCQSNDPQCKRCSTRAPTQSCTFSISYAEGSSLQGIIIKDSIQFQSYSTGQQIIASFGCTTTETNLFLKQQANGIFGLAPQRTSNLLEQLYKKHHDFSGEQMEFSLCLSGNGGQMVIGGVNKGLGSTQQPVKIGYSAYRNLYSLSDVKKLSIGDAMIHQEGQKFGYYGIFVDSGSTFTYFPRQKYDIFKNQLIKKCSARQNQCQIAEGESTLCFHLMGKQQIQQQIDRIFDPILIQVSDSILKWYPSKYFLLRDKNNRQICLGIQALDRYLLGANWMIDRKIVFNLKDKQLMIYNNVDCGRKQKSIRQMSQYTSKVQGHQPLSYKSSNGFISSINTTIKLTFGIILTFFGTLGLIVIIVKRNQQKQREKLSRLSPVQTQQNIQELSNS